VKRRPLLAAAVTLVLSACSALPSREGAPEPAALRENPAAATLPAQKPLGTARPETPAPPAPTPDQLVGLTPLQMVELIGTPDLRRKEAQAEMWQYVSGPCVLDVFLYEDKEGTARVAHTNLRSQNAAKTPREACLGDMVRQKRS
jgi:hypothetical protein